MGNLGAIPQTTAAFRAVCRTMSDETATAHIALAPTPANAWLTAMHECMVADGVPAGEARRITSQATTAVTDLYNALYNLPTLWQELGNAIMRMDHAVTRARDSHMGNTFNVDG
jgi:hypothetical protein